MKDYSYEKEGFFIKIIKENTAITIGVSQGTKMIIKEHNPCIVLDYGCGKLRNSKKLVENNFLVYIHDTKVQLERIKNSITSDMIVLTTENNFDIILCSYVLNVIPDIKERIEVIKHISSLLSEEGYLYIEVRSLDIEKSNKTAESYNDGYVMGKGETKTFQKSFDKEELIVFIESYSDLQGVFAKNNSESILLKCINKRKENVLRVFEAFSGYGSQALALKKIGVNFKTVAISEIDKYAIKAYEALHSKVLNLGDISKIDIDYIPDHDLFTYSFPCTDISEAGQQKGLDEGSNTRSSLLWECKKIIQHKKPKYLLMENVKNLVSKNHINNFNKWLNWLEEQGYKNYWKVLDGKDFGIPQHRERVFVVSILGEHTKFKFPEPFDLKLRLKDLLETEVDEKYYVPPHIQERYKEYNNSLKNNECKVNRLGGMFDGETRHQAGSVYDTEGIAPCLDTMQGGWRQPCIKVIGKLHCKGWYDIETRVHDIEGISPTIETRNRSKYMDNTRIRKLMPIECFKLMGVTIEQYHLIEKCNLSNTQLYKMAGNSIIVDVIENVFKSMFKDYISVEGENDNGIKQRI